MAPPERGGTLYSPTYPPYLQAGESITSTPVPEELAPPNHFRDFLQRSGNILDAAKSDIGENENRLEQAKTLVSGLGVAAMQAVGISKLPTVITPIVTVFALENTGSPILAGVATGTLYGVWSMVGTQTISYGVSHFPRALKAVGGNYPKATRRLYNSLPGFKDTDEQAHSSRFVRVARKLGNLAQTHLRRGLAAYTISTAFMLTAGLNNQTIAERRKLSARLSLDGGVVAGLLATGIAEAPAQVQHALVNPLYLYGATALLMGGQFAINKFKTRETSDPVAT